MKNKIKVGVLVAIIVLVAIGYVLTQGTAIAKTDRVLQEVEKAILADSLTTEKAQKLRDEFLIVSASAQEQSASNEYGLHDLSALLQAHLTTLDVIDNNEFDEEVLLIRNAVITRIVEVESLLIGDTGNVILIEDGVRDLVNEVENTLEEFKDIQGTIPSRMFDEVQVSIQQASVALGEAQSALTENMENEALRATLRARRFIKEAQHIIELAELIQKYDYRSEEVNVEEN